MGRFMAVAAWGVIMRVIGVVCLVRFGPQRFLSDTERLTVAGAAGLTA